MNLDLKSTTSIETPEGGVIFQQGVILRKVSKFLSGGEEDGLLPIPVFYDPITNKIIKDTIPADLREEYSKHVI